MSSDLPATLQLTHPKDNFDAIRLIAALVVLYGHAFPLSGVPSPALFGNEVQTLAVKVFFSISGYLVMGSWMRDPSWGHYLWKRCLRIFPGLIVCILLSAFVLGPVVTRLPVSEYFRNPWFVRYLGNMALYPSYALPGVFEHIAYPNAVNGSLWSLPVEFAMYLIAPLVVLWGRGQKVRIVIGSFVLCVLGLYLVRFAPPQKPIVFYATSIVSALDAAPYFFLGAAWKIAAPKEAFDLQTALLAVLLLATIPQSSIAHEIALYIVLPYAILSFSLAKPAAFGWMGRLGDFSYGVYVYGFVVQQTISFVLQTQGKPFLNFGLALVPTLLLAAASWHLVEKRFLALKPLRRRPAVSRKV
ncbi:acyltransferase [Caballeronia sp. GAWG2-1]|uniref:acyltransferase family protein n=1 Tax=Caballeronia sp. GAWG2-1 TaxID=2921744 RepID=UPI0020288D2F|nr:acyltransferase [Caballeronia sp. GAWG2-1]